MTTDNFSVPSQFPTSGGNCKNLNIFAVLSEKRRFNIYHSFFVAQIKVYGIDSQDFYFILPVVLLRRYNRYDSVYRITR